MKVKCLILGGGISGIGTAQLAIKNGFDVFVSDNGFLKDETKEKFKTWGVSWEENVKISSFFHNTDWIMKSPGISNSSESVLYAKKLGIPIISEIEFASRYTNAKIIGITGTNGKTTTTELTYHILKNSGFNIGIAGNIGKSFAQQVAENSYEIYVLELSSFQLDDIVNFSPDIAIITNITPDHLNRYNNNFDDYISSKLNISSNQDKDQFLIINADDPILMEAIEKTKIEAEKHYFGINMKGNSTTSLKNESIRITNKNNNSTMISAKTFSLKGRHNLLNAMAASTVASIFKIDKNNIRESLSNFRCLPHRLERVLTIQGVNYINDSKATNINSVFYALETLNTKVVWIAGGVDKGNDYEQLLPLVREKIKAIICLGKNNKRLVEAFHDITDVIVETQSMKEAVKIAHNLSKKKETVLLSPACASFDLFENFEDRGNQFKKAVRSL
ncbi:MAG: UDP-N-acetylmuramoyl-L-alanine--D-glutamate ligase [Flavobacteriaceae bacterium]|nr:UDP-N-acetylmuramoyl-L-alanine--D-glutamate ligase [Flavobacteriaceae bacterium]